LNNVTSIFLITGYTVDMLVQSKSLIDAAKRNGVTHIVHLGAFTREHDSYATVFAWHQMIEAYLRDSGIAWTNLHPNMFMQKFIMPKVSKTMRRSLVQHSNQRMQREDSNCSARSRTEEWRTLEA